MKNLTLAVCALAVSSAPALAQPAQTEPQIRHAAPGRFIAHEGPGPERVTKGAPFSAETYTEFRQMLGDGNIIERKHRGATYRDAEGRVRTEHGAPAVGSVAATGQSDFIVIRDPVASVQWVLNPDLKTAIKTPLPGTVSHAAMPPGGGGAPMRMRQPAPGSRVEAPKEEKLGASNINGVQAEGTRTTMTIPAGNMGNVRPIEVVTERWFAPQLQVVVKSRHADPRTGEQVFEMTNIRPGEPAPSLFQPPADYKVTEGRAPARVDVKIRRQAPAPHE